MLQTFLGLSKQQVEEFFGIETYLKQFGNLGPGFPNVRDAVWQAESKEWQCTLRFEEVDFVQRCATQKTGVANENMQMIGQMCARHVKSPFASRVKALQSRPQQMPVRALSNNLWTGFATPLLAEERVSDVEAILASPCMLSLVCFSLETQYGNVMLEGAQQQRFRVGARGNITMGPGLASAVAWQLHLWHRQCTGLW